MLVAGASKRTHVFGIFQSPLTFATIDNYALRPLDIDTSWHSFRQSCNLHLKGIKVNNIGPRSFLKRLKSSPLFEILPLRLRVSFFPRMETKLFGCSTIPRWNRLLDNFLIWTPDIFKQFPAQYDHRTNHRFPPRPRPPLRLILTISSRWTRLCGSGTTSDQRTLQQLVANLRPGPTTPRRRS